MSHNKKLSLLLITIAAGVGIAWLAKRRSPDAPGLSVWQRLLAEEHGAARACSLAEKIRRRYRQLLAGCSIPAHAELKSHLLGYILPGLALYQTLLEDNGGDRQAALQEVNRLFRASTLHRTRLLSALLRILPDPFPLFRRAFPAIMKAYPPQGWEVTPVELSDQRIAFDITRCYYLDTLTAYGAPELTASFCKMDEVMAEAFPPQIRFVRHHTLGQGGAVCDFQYYHGRG